MVDLKLDMFDFLIKPIRDHDRLEGNDFVSRFLQGGQEVWETTLQKAEDIKQLWSYTECPDEYLQYLKRIVGWTPDLDSITRNLDFATLRRLIAVSIPLWKKRSSEDSIISTLNLLAPGRCRIWNWFDFRWVTDETIFSEEHQGRDPWMIYFPGPPENDEFWSNVRLVDPGVDNRQIVKDVLGLMRPCGERYLITYLKLLDLFTIEGDYSQWDVTLGNPPTVEDGMIKLSTSGVAETVSANTEGSTSWSNYVVFARVRGTGAADFGVFFYWQPASLNGYAASLKVSTNQVNLAKMTAGVPSYLDQFDLDDIGFQLQESTWYGLRVQVSPEGSNTRIKVYFNGTEVIDYLDSSSPYTEGTVGIVNLVASTVDCDEIEVMGMPTETDTVEINY